MVHVLQACRLVVFVLVIVGAIFGVDACGAGGYEIVAITSIGKPYSWKKTTMKMK